MLCIAVGVSIARSLCITIRHSRICLCSLSSINQAKYLVYSDPIKTYANPCAHGCTNANYHPAAKRITITTQDRTNNGSALIPRQITSLRYRLQHSLYLYEHPCSQRINNASAVSPHIQWGHTVRERGSGLESVFQIDERRMGNIAATTIQHETIGRGAHAAAA